MTDWADLRNLVLVAGHAIPFRFENLDGDASWFLKHFQSGEGRFYVEHARAGVRLAAEDSHALLVFAGGQTDAAAGPRSEAQGYWLIAEAFGWEGSPEVRGRATTEEFSLDSMLNLIYGICRFRESTGRYPDRLTVVGWRFKQQRFDVHRQALRFPAERYRYVGVNDPPEVETHRPFEAGRRDAFLRDPYGASADLAQKRDGRNPFRRRHGYEISCPELADLLGHRGPEIFAGPLPWDIPPSRSEE
jgi:hypothetical protein